MDPETRLLRIAARQRSVFSYGQAVTAGVSPSMINRRVAAGRWRRVFRGVYADASVAIGWQERLLGALLCCGERSVASFTSAGAVWDLIPEEDVPEVTVLSQTSRCVAGIVVHRTARLDAVEHRGFRVTHPMRTLVDLAGCLPDEHLERVLDDAHRRGLIGLDRFERFLDLPTNRARPATGELRRMVEIRDPRRGVGSHLETIFLRTLRRAGLPLPAAQHPVRTRTGTRYIDFAYPDAGVAIELDGYADHSSRAAFEGDRVRQNELVRLGWRVLRFTWTQVETEAVNVVATVGAALGLRPVRWA